jgi:hypothetical protein
VTVLPHEVYVLQRHASELGVRAVFTPAYRIAELKSGMRIALSYLMQLDEEGKCPFLRGVKCAVHDLYKPLTCRAFPYLPRVIKYELLPHLREIRINVKFVMSTLCPVVRRDLTPAAAAMMSDVSVAAEYAPHEVRAAVETLRGRYLYVKMLNELWKREVVELDEEGKYLFFPIVNGFVFLRRFYPDLTLDKLVRALSE